MSSCTLEWYAW